MKPYIAQILEHNGNTCKLPIPAKYRELLSCVNTLGLKDVADEEDMVVVGYETTIGIKPELTDSWWEIEDSAKSLSTLTMVQVNAVVAAYNAFNFTKFADISGISEYLKQGGITE
ncbi:MAG: hypothetical protein LBN97_08655 [Oscillospiraceae bacterium]|jgi:hypothetical protein|nr:hypothetical protein [Oscillospiraceae bacterium]